MSTTRKRTADQAWDALEEEAIDDEVQRVLALSDEALDAELAKAGADPTKIRARGATLAARSGKSAAPTPIRRTGWVIWLAAATLGGLVVGVALMNRPVQVAQPRPESPEGRAASIRDVAKAACVRHSWAECHDLLDKAKDLDPEGDRTPWVQGERRAIEQGLHR